MAEIVSVTPLYEKSPATQRRYAEVVVFVHNYGGHRRSFRKQIEFVNQLGFDVVTFDLPDSRADKMQQVPLSRTWQFGLRHIWADKIEDVLGGLPEKKFLFSFSFPSISALMALERRRSIDIKGWICDGGPFGQIRRGFHNLVAIGGFSFMVRGREMIAGNPLLKIASVKKSISWMAAELMGSRHYYSDAKTAMESLPQGFPILSLRGEKDTVVTPDMIDDIFTSTFDKIDWQRVTLPNTGHLTGMTDDAELYKSTVEAFLIAKATLL